MNDRKELIDNSRMIMRLLRERKYEPLIARGPDGAWVITFEYEKPDGTYVTWFIRNDSLISEQWWLN